MYEKVKLTNVFLHWLLNYGPGLSGLSHMMALYFTSGHSGLPANL